MNEGRAPRLVVGLTGPNAAGKGEVARYLVSRGLAYHSLSDIIRDESARRGLPATRENLIEIGNDLRRAGGPGSSPRGPWRGSRPRRGRFDPERGGGGGAAAGAGLRPDRRRGADRGSVRPCPRALPPGGRRLPGGVRGARGPERSGDPAAQQIHMTVEMADLSVDNSGSIADLHDRVASLLAGRL